MNTAFLNLPQAKRHNLVNAGYRAFSQSPYNKASMAAVAAEAGISKALLFYYFQNKREYYLYLFAQAMDLMREARLEAIPAHTLDLFDWVRQSVLHRLSMLKEYPCLIRFATRAYYETDPAVQPAIASQKQLLLGQGTQEILARIDPAPLIDPADAEMLLTLILNVAEGCMRGQEVLHATQLNAIVAGFDRMMDSLKRHYYRPEAWKENRV